jgi:hypothetical protein
MLHAWAKYGATRAGAEFLAKYDPKHGRRRPPKFPNVVRGKLIRLKAERGEDEVYLKLMHKFLILEKLDL